MNGGNVILHLNSPVFISTVLKLIPGGGTLELQGRFGGESGIDEFGALKESAGS